MSLDLLDVAFPPSDPAQLVSDVRALGARAVGLYVVNWSAPRAVVSAAYAQKVAAAGVGVLPIVTPGQSPGPVSAVMAALAAWWPGDGSPVGCDIEQPGIDTPDPAWVNDLVQSILSARFASWLYENASTRSTYPWGSFWEADWTFADHLDAGSIATQYTDAVTGPSGTRYDGSTVAAGVTFHGESRTKQETDMLIFTTDGQPAIFVCGLGAFGIPDQATEQALMAAGVPVAPVTASFFEDVFQAAQNKGGPGAAKITFTPSGSVTLTAA